MNWNCLGCGRAECAPGFCLSYLLAKDHEQGAYSHCTEPFHLQSGKIVLTTTHPEFGESGEGTSGSPEYDQAKPERLVAGLLHGIPETLVYHLKIAQGEPGTGPC